MENSLACYLCNRTYRVQYVLNRHLREVHKIKVLPGGNLKCPLCVSFSVNRQSTLRLHLEEKHDIKCERRNIKFSSYEVFQRWKSSEEKASLFTYTKKTSTKAVAGRSERFYFHCHRSGHYQTKSTGERRLKSQGSNRMDSTCPSMMVATRDASGRTRVNYWRTHVGHCGDVAHTALPRRLRARILGGGRQPRPANPSSKVEAVDDVATESPPVADVRVADVRVVIRRDDASPARDDNEPSLRFRPTADLRDITLTVTEVTEEPEPAERLSVPTWRLDPSLFEAAVFREAASLAGDSVEAATSRKAAIARNAASLAGDSVEAVTSRKAAIACNAASLADDSVEAATSHKAAIACNAASLAGDSVEAATSHKTAIACNAASLADDSVKAATSRKAAIARNAASLAELARSHAGDVDSHTVAEILRLLGRATDLLLRVRDSGGKDSTST